jgi:hypothetical protein
MPTIQVGPRSDQELQQIADSLARARKVVVITGAGISTNCGIPVSGDRPALQCRLLTYHRTFDQKMDSTP